MLRVCAFTGGANDPSSRFRIRQYIPRLRELGVWVDDFSSRAGRYPPRSMLKRPVWGGLNLLEHVPSVLRSYGYDVTFLQREMLSTFGTLERVTRAPRVFDIDDAIYLHRGGAFVRRIVSRCERVICGNRFIAERIAPWQPKLRIIPTPVDTERYTPRVPSTDRPVIGWVGTPGNFAYFTAIEEALHETLRRHPRSVLRVISSEPPRLSRIPRDRFEFVKWSAETEVADIQALTIGIMPLANGEWELGKCSFKMLQYMSCGIPVVASPVGMNAEVLSHDKVGLAATTIADWVDQLDWLIGHPAEAAEFGAAGRRVVQDRYSLAALAPKLASALDLTTSDT